MIDTLTQVRYGVTDGLKRVPIVITQLDCICGDTMTSRFESATIKYANSTQVKLKGEDVKTSLADQGIKFWVVTNTITWLEIESENLALVGTTIDFTIRVYSI